MSKLDVVIDLETVTLPVTQEDIDEYMRKEYKGAPSNWKDPIKIEMHRVEAHQEAGTKILESRRFSVDGARVVSAALGTIRNGKVEDIEGYFSEDETELAKFMVQYLQGVSCYRIVGANIKGFDIPHMCRMLYKAGLSLPNLPTKWDFIDILKEGPLKDQRMSCKRAAKAFGINPLVPDVDGSKVGSLYDAGEYQKIVDYNKSDVDLEGRLFLALSTAHKF